MEALRLHDDAIEVAVESQGGVSVKPRGEGDSRFIVFRSAEEGVEGAANMQRSLANVQWPTPRPLRVRASLHTGLAELEPTLDEVEFAELRASGAQRQYREVVKELAETADLTRDLPGGILREYA